MTAVQQSARSSETLPTSPASVMPEDWRLAAACRGMSDEVFFVSQGRAAAEAKAVCEGCPVRAECLDYAIRHEIHHGVWGGLTENERRKLKRGIEASTFDHWCIVCRSPFDSEEPETRYCSRHCYRKAWARRRRRFSQKAVEPPSDRCAWPGCEEGRDDGALCAEHGRLTVPTEESHCRWPGCSQPPELSAALCYLHGKVARDLVEIGEETVAQAV